MNPGETLGLLMESRRHSYGIGVLGNPDPSAALPGLAARAGWTGVGIVRRNRKALIPARDQASDAKDWERVRTISVLRDALRPVRYA